MPNKSIVKSSAKTSKFPASLESAPLNSIREILPDKTIQDACHQVNYNYRNSFITPIVTVLHMILAAIFPEKSFNASWELLWSSFVSNNPSSCYCIVCCWIPAFAGMTNGDGDIATQHPQAPLHYA